MTYPRLAMLIHGKEGSIEWIRAQGLSSRWPADRLLMLGRSSSRGAIAREWWQQIRRWRPDVLYVLNTAMPGALLAPAWKRLTGKPFILDTGDAVYEMALRSGVTPTWKRPILRYVENAAQREAGAVVVRGTRHREHLLGAGVTNVKVIRDGFVPAARRDPTELPALRERLGLQGYWVLGVLGSLVFSPRLKICYGWDLIEALALLRDLPIRGLIIGDGDGRAWLEKKAEDHKVRGRIVFTGRIPYDTVPLHLSLMDFALSTQTNNLPGQVRTTGKLPEYMATGRFILASRVGEAALLLPEIMLIDYHGEVDHAYPERLASRIRRLVLEPNLMDARHQLPRVAEENCAYPVLARQFEDVVRSLLRTEFNSPTSG